MPIRNINGCEMKSINDVSKETSMSQSNIRKYRELGLISAITTKQESLTYMWFDDVAVLRIKMIQMFRKLDFKLKEIKDMFDSPDFDQNAMLDKLIARLKAERGEITRQIEFCEMSKYMGIKASALLATSSGSIESYMEQLYEAMQRLTTKYEIDLDDDSFEKSFINKLTCYSDLSAFEPTSNKAQAFMDSIIEDFERGIAGFLLGRGPVSDIGTHIYALVVLIFLLLGSGDWHNRIAQQTDEGFTTYLVQASVYCCFRNLDRMLVLLRKEYDMYKDKMSLNEYAALLRQRLCAWTEDIRPISGLATDDFILDVIKDGLEFDEGDCCDPEIADEVFKEIQKAWKGLPL